LLENDLILTRFLDLHEATLSDDEVDALTRLLEVPDNDLMGLLLGQNEPSDELNQPHVHALLARLRQA
jgi:antitoxin CptB